MDHLCSFPPEYLDMDCRRIAVSIIVPCFNEEDGLFRLREKLESAELLLRREYAVHFIIVDDGSTDGTWDVLSRLFGRDPNVDLVRHPRNLGIGGAILTGVRRAMTEIVCSMDSDCTYDPADLVQMIPLLKPGVDLVTASPYHPQGEVEFVPAWRLMLSRTASLLYRIVLKQKLYTYTSCFRVYRRSSILGLKLGQSGFLAVAELLAKLDLQDSMIVEHPAKLTSRIHGASKMKTAKVLLGHLQLLGELIVARIKQSSTITPQWISARPGDL